MPFNYSILFSDMAYARLVTLPERRNRTLADMVVYVRSGGPFGAYRSVLA